MRKLGASRSILCIGCTVRFHDTACLLIRRIGRERRLDLSVQLRAGGKQRAALVDEWLEQGVLPPGVILEPPAPRGISLLRDGRLRRQRGSKHVFVRSGAEAEVLRGVE